MVTIIDFDGKPVDAYSKDEVIAMLTELKNGALANSEAIQQKIDELKDNKNDKLGMTFDEAIETIKGEKWIACQEKYQEAMNLIETTMQKYQQLEQIINDCWKTDGGVFQMTDNYYLKKIGEILDN